MREGGAPILLLEKTVSVMGVNKCELEFYCMILLWIKKLIFPLASKKEEWIDLREKTNAVNLEADKWWILGKYFSRENMNSALSWFLSS